MRRDDLLLQCIGAITAPGTPEEQACRADELVHLYPQEEVAECLAALAQILVVELDGHGQRPEWIAERLSLLVLDVFMPA